MRLLVQPTLPETYNQKVSSWSGWILRQSHPRFDTRLLSLARIISYQESPRQACLVALVQDEDFHHPPEHGHGRPGPCSVPVLVHRASHPILWSMLSPGVYHVVKLTAADFVSDFRRLCRRLRLHRLCLPVQQLAVCGHSEPRSSLRPQRLRWSSPGRAVLRRSCLLLCLVRRNGDHRQRDGHCSCFVD